MSEIEKIEKIEKIETIGKKEKMRNLEKTGKCVSRVIDAIHRRKRLMTMIMSLAVLMTTIAYPSVAYGNFYMFNPKNEYIKSRTLEELLQLYADDGRVKEGPFLVSMYQFDPSVIKDRKEMKRLIMKYGSVYVGQMLGYAAFADYGFAVDNHAYAFLGWYKDEEGNDRYLYTQGLNQETGSVDCARIESIPDNVLVTGGTNASYFIFTVDVSDTDPAQGYKLIQSAAHDYGDQPRSGAVFENQSDHRYKIKGGYYYSYGSKDKLTYDRNFETHTWVPQDNDLTVIIEKDLHDPSQPFDPATGNMGVWNYSTQEQMKFHHKAHQTMGYVDLIGVDGDVYIDPGEKVVARGYGMRFLAVEEMDDAGTVGSFTIKDDKYTISSDEPGVKMNVEAIGETPVYTVEDPKICSVSPDGYITPGLGGTTKIHASTENGTNIKTREVTVYRKMGELEVPEEYEDQDYIDLVKNEPLPPIKVYSTIESGHTDLTDDMKVVTTRQWGENTITASLKGFDVFSKYVDLYNTFLPYYTSDTSFEAKAYEAGVSNQPMSITREVIGLQSSYTIDKKAPFEKYCSYIRQNELACYSKPIVYTYTQDGFHEAADISKGFNYSLFPDRNMQDNDVNVQLMVTDENTNVGTREATISFSGSRFVEDGEGHINVEITPKRVEPYRKNSEGNYPDVTLGSETYVKAEFK